MTVQPDSLPRVGLIDDQTDARLTALAKPSVPVHREPTIATLTAALLIVQVCGLR